MLKRTNQWFILIAGTLVSPLALAQAVIISSPLVTQSYDSKVDQNTAIQNNSTVKSLTISTGSLWFGTNLYGLYNTTGNTVGNPVGTGGFIVSSGATVYGGTAAIQNATGAFMYGSNSNTINNSGTIGKSGVSYSINGIYNNGTLDNGGITSTVINNLGLITGSNAGIFNGTAGTIDNPSQGGLISSLAGTTIGGPGATYGIYNAGNISGGFGVAFTIGGTLSGSYSGIYNAAGATITNRWTQTLSNSGTIGGAGSQYGIYNLGTISDTRSPQLTLTLNNTGTISGTVDGIYNGASGIISSTTGNAIQNGGTVSSITNLGAITGGTGGYGINNTGVITTLNNLKGGVAPLTYTGTLPTNYNVIVNSTSAYGKLSGTSLTGTTTFGVAPTSTLVVNTYAAVLSGFTTANLANISANTVTGTLSGYAWTLQSEGGLTPTIWDLIVTCPVAPCPATTPNSGGGSSSSAGNNSSAGSSNPPPTPTPAPAPLVPLSTGTTLSLASVGVTTSPVFAGGTLTLTSGANTSQPFTVTSAGGTIATPSGGSATMSGGLTGTGPMTINGDGTLVLSGASTYSGGTNVASGTLDVAGSSPTGTGDIVVASAATLMGTGTIPGNVIVNGVFKPGNSPGYLSVASNVTFNSGGTYQQDIAGRAQASATSPAGATGYYSFLNVGGQYIINPGATLTPRLQNLFSPSESGYGSAPYVPVVGDKFRILTADGGITGKFTTLTQPAGLDPATQFLSFYNYNSSNSLDLAVIPASFNTAVASSSGNKNAQSVASALDKMVVANQASTSTAAQDALLFTASGQSLASLPSFTQGMAGEIYGATLAVVPQTSQRVQQAVISRLGDTMTAPVMAGAMAAVTNTAISATNPGGQPTASMSSNPNVNPYASGSGGMSMSNGAAWGEVAYQYGNRASDSNSGGWSSNLVQAVVGVDMYSAAGTKAGGGVALSNTNVSASQSSGTVQQGSLFLYGKLPVQQFVVDAMASYGFNSTNNSRNDATGITTGLQAKNVQGNDALVSLGLNLPIDMAESRVTPYIRATWQQVNQNGFNEGSAASALTINSFNGNGVRGVIGVAAGSKALDPIKEQYTYRVNVGLGADSTNVLNPQLNASLAGMTTTINTPGAGAAFVQAGMYGTIKFADNAFAYAGVTAEARSGQVLAGGNIGVRVQF